MPSDYSASQSAAVSAKPDVPQDRRGESISLAKSIRPYVPAKSHPWKAMKRRAKK